MRPEYDDLDGTRAARPDVAVPGWRVSCYPIALRDGRVLMVEPVWAHRWELPGGGVEIEREETIVEAAVRECYEETGYPFAPEPTTLRFTGEHFFSVRANGNFYHSLTFTVLGSVHGEPAPGWTARSDEIIRVEWLDPHTLSPDRVQPIHLAALAAVGLARGPDRND